MKNVLGLSVLLVLVVVLLEVRESTSQTVLIAAKVGKCGQHAFRIIKYDENMAPFVSCFPCFACPPGQGHVVECGSFIRKKDRNKVRCVPCSKGTYSDSFSISSCQPCKTCGKGSTVMRKCTPTSDTYCTPRRSNCKQGFYFSEILLHCLPCSHCCDDGHDIKKEECRATQRSQTTKLCSVQSKHRCPEKEKDVHDENPTQSIGKRMFSILPHIITRESNTETPSTGLSTFRLINTEVDTRKYSNNRTNNSNWTRNYHLISKDNLSIRLPFILILVILVLALIALILIIQTRLLLVNGKSRGLNCFPQTRLSKNKTIADMCKGDQSDALEDWSNNDFTDGIYLFKCGVTVKYDQNSKEDKYKSLVVETLNEENGKNSKALKSNQLFLSPIFKFYSQGERFEKPVKISLPHSALWTAENKNWVIEIIYIDERKGKDAKWKKVEGDIEISWKDASFYSDTLLTYAVVGKPLQGAKKRMQFVIFAMDEMMSDRFEVNIHLLDDNESSYQRIVKENKSKGFSMLDSFYAAFVDCSCQTDISINVQGLLDGWDLDCLDPKTISSFDCANTSYFTIPSFKAVFRRTKRRAEKFTCKFILDVSGSKIIIPAFTFLPKEELCVKVDIHEEDCSPIKQNTTRFIYLPYDVLYVISRMLDVSVKGQGTWREIGRHFGLGDELVQFSVEYATLEGSPSRALFEYLHATKPDITVGEFAQCLESLGREDVMSVLYKHRKKICMNGIKATRNEDIKQGIIEAK